MTVICELLGAAVALSVFPLVMMAVEEEGSASGWIEVKGQRVALRHAFAAMSENVLERGTEIVKVLLSDKPVPMELRKATDAWSSWAGDAAQEGELHGIIVCINPDTKVWNWGQRLSQQHGMESYSQSVSSPELSDLVFAPASAGPGEIAGKVSMKQAMQGVDESGGPWRVEAEFRTPVAARPAVTGSFTGAAARESAPYQVVKAYLLACQERDLEGIRKTMSPSSREMMAQFESAQGPEAVLEMFLGEAAETQKLKLTSVTLRGDTAEVVLSSNEQVLPLMLDNGAWKIGQ